MRKYTILLEPDPEEGGYTVTVPALPGCITQGETIEQCIERAQEAITVTLKAFRPRVNRYQRKLNAPK